MSIRTQLIILVLVPLFCVTGAVGGMFYTQRIANLAAQGAAHSAPLHNELSDFILFLQEPPAGSGKTAHYHLQAVRNRISNLTTDVKPVFATPDEQQLLEKLNAAPGQLGKRLDQIIQGNSILTSRNAALLTQEIKSYFPAFEQLNSHYQHLLQTTTQRIYQVNLLLLLIAALWPLLLSILLYRTLARPLAQLKDGVAAVARGDLSYRLSAEPNGELGRLATAFNKMIDVRQKAETSGKAAEDRLKDLFENLQMAVVCLDVYGAVNYCNGYLLRSTGRKRHEVIGKNWFDLFIPDSESLKQVFRHMIDKGEAIPYFQNAILTKSGEHRMMAWNNTIERDQNGAITGTTSIGSDITEQHTAEQALEQSQRTLRTLVDSNPEALLLTDSNGIILTANLAFAKRLNKTPQQVAGCNLFSLFDDPDLNKNRRACLEQVVADGQPLIFNDKRDLWAFENHIYPVKDADGSVQSVSILSIDITGTQRTEQELKQANELLRSSNEGLEQRVTERTAELTRLNQELAQARDAAEGSNRSKSAFLANMSHEIRTPMNAILGLVHLALQTELTSKQREYLDTVSNSAQSLLEIINGILDVSRIEAGKLQMETIPFSLDGVVSRSVGLLAQRAQQKKLSLLHQVESDIPDALVGDPLRLEQVLVNLLGNAVKFTDSGSIVLHISRGSAQPPPNQVMLELTVRDTGIGMDAETLARLFKPFSQGDTSTTRTHGGSGLGLTICRHLAEMMGGTITVESSPGSGSSFCFTALLGVGKQGRHKTKINRQDLAQQYRMLKGLRVLLAEDHTINRQIACEILEAVGIQVKTVNNGQEAVTFMQEHGNDIDLILMDIQMPVLDGLEATRRIRQFFSSKRLPIIAMTAHALHEERDVCLAAGMNDHLAKPFVVEKLYELLARMTGRRPSETLTDGIPTNQDGSSTDNFPQLLPGIVVDTALSRVNGNKRLLAQLIRLFAQEQQGTPDEIRHLISDNELAAAARVVHGLKGVAGNLSAEHLQSAAANLETALKMQDAKAAEHLLPALESAMSEICTTAALFAEPDTPENRADQDAPGKTDDLFAELQHLLEIHSLEVAAPLDRLRSLFAPGGEDRAQLDSLAEAVQRLDYQQALMLLQSMTEKIGICKESQ